MTNRERWRATNELPLLQAFRSSEPTELQRLLHLLFSSQIKPRLRLIKAWRSSFSKTSKLMSTLSLAYFTFTPSSLDDALLMVNGLSTLLVQPSVFFHHLLSYPVFFYFIFLFCSCANLLYTTNVVTVVQNFSNYGETIVSIMKVRKGVFHFMISTLKTLIICYLNNYDMLMLR